MNIAIQHTKRTKTPVAQTRIKTKKSGFLKPLAESVILQAMEDLLSNRNRDESIEFFKGNGFSVYANIAEMRPHEKNILMRLITGSLTGQRSNNPRPYTILSEKVKDTPQQGKED
jgi:hypothetical protein